MFASFLGCSYLFLIEVNGTVCDITKIQLNKLFEWLNIWLVDGQLYSDASYIVPLFLIPFINVWIYAG